MAEQNVPKEDIPAATEEEVKPLITRRDFLIGAGAGAVAGAAVAAAITGSGGQSPAAAPAEVAGNVAAPEGGAQEGAAAEAVAEEAAGEAMSESAVQAAMQASELPATMRRVSMNINGQSYDVTTDVRWSLWEVLVYKLGLAGAKRGCDRAECGACAVLVDGRSVNSCTVLAARLDGAEIMTVEGLATGGAYEGLHPIQQAYIEEGGFQCGFCTPGFIMSTYALLSENLDPTEDDIREALGGNICRCSEYPKIYDSVLAAAEAMRQTSG